jgi:hypothetical protein
MRSIRKLLVALAGACMCTSAPAGVTSCWIKELTHTETQLEVTFESTDPLVFIGSAERLSASTSPPHTATYVFNERQTLVVKASESSRERCELEPMLGPLFNGVSRSVWLWPLNGTEPMFLGGPIRAKPKQPVQRKKGDA